MERGKTPRRNVTFLDSAGLHSILELYRTVSARGVSLHLVEGEAGNVGRVLRSAGLESLIDACKDPIGCA